jgi:8-oxo-dGTP pyrophosphatase MutT (NUDIX family)
MNRSDGSGQFRDGENRPPRVIPRDAASVILVRNEGESVEALLLRKHADLAFAGGTWVFPGGKVEAADGSDDARLLCGGHGTVSVPRSGSRSDMLPFVAAACRETFEECGVLIARHADGTSCRPEIADALQRFRAEIADSPDTFVRLLNAHDLVVDSDRFVFWAHWITPAAATKRFDTRFFITEMPDGQTVRCDSAEATELHWLDLASFEEMPSEALVPAPATRCSLADLAASVREHGSFEYVLSAERERSVPPIMPKILRIGGNITVLLPWDPEYQATPGEGTPGDVEIPGRYQRFPARLYPPPDTRGIVRA